MNPHLETETPSTSAALPRISAKSSTPSKARRRWTDLLPALLLAAPVSAAVVGACSTPVEPYEVLKGPFATALTKTTASIRWDAEKENVARITLIDEKGKKQSILGTATKHELTTEYLLDDFLDENTLEQLGIDNLLSDEPGTAWLHTVELSGLNTGTCYTYQIDGDQKQDDTHRFCTMREKGDVVKVAVIGDTSDMDLLANKNPNDNGNQLLTEGTITDLAPYIRKEAPDFIAHVGDVQYYSSIIESWAQWGKSMRQLYSAAGVFAVLGNHEFENCGKYDDDTPIEKGSSDCVEFKDYYARYFGQAGEGTDRWYTYSTAGVYFFALDTESSLNEDSEQGKWLVEAMEKARKKDDFRFSVLQLHRPLYSLNRPSHGPRPFLESLIEKNNIRLVLVGHVHGYERFEVGQVLHITTGGGGGLISNLESDADKYSEDAKLRKAVAATNHFTMLEIGSKKLKGKAIDRKGKVIDTFEWPLE